MAPHYTVLIRGLTFTQDTRGKLSLWIMTVFKHREGGKKQKTKKGYKQGSPATCFERALLKCVVCLVWVLRNLTVSERSCRAVWACGAASPASCHPRWESPSWVELWRWRGPQPAEWPEPSSPPWEWASEHPYRTAMQSPLWDTEEKKETEGQDNSWSIIKHWEPFGGGAMVVAECHYKGKVQLCKQPKKNKCQPVNIAKGSGQYCWIVVLFSSFNLKSKNGSFNQT